MLHTGQCAGIEQHAHDVLGAAVGKQLAFVFFVKGDAVFFYQVDKVLRRKARQGRAGKLRVLSQVVLVAGARVEVAVGEVAAPTAGDADFFGHPLGVVDEQHAQAALARLCGAKQACRPCAHNDNVKIRHKKKASVSKETLA